MDKALRAFKLMNTWKYWKGGTPREDMEVLCHAPISCPMHFFHKLFLHCVSSKSTLSNLRKGHVVVVVELLSRVFCEFTWTIAHQASGPGDFSGKNTRSGLQFPPPGRVMEPLIYSQLVTSKYRWQTRTHKWCLR